VTSRQTRACARRCVTFVSVVACALLATPSALAFPYLVKPGETLAQIAARMYGDPKLETVLAGANALDSQGGSVIVAGMHMEIPAPGHHRVAAGEGWADLALVYLGDTKRADVLARANHTVPWMPPAQDLEIEIPAVIAHIASAGETSTLLAGRYLGDPNRGWELNSYNARREAPLGRGEILLVPVLDLPLSEAGKSEARHALERAVSEGETAGLVAQRRAEAELPALAADLRATRYLEAVARGNALLGRGELTRPVLGAIHRALLEAYVALEATGLATVACTAWLANDPEASLDPRWVSPKIRAVCPKR
jgi:hypothetical protein